MAAEAVAWAAPSAGEELLRAAEHAKVAIADLARAVADAESATSAGCNDGAGGEGSVERRGDHGLTATLHVLDDACSLLGAARSGVVSMVRSRGLWRVGRAKSYAQWRGESSGQGRGAALREERTSEALDQLAAVREAVNDGSVSMGHAEVIGQVLGDAAERTRERLVAAQGQIRDAATRQSVPELRKNLTAMAAAIEADSADHSFEAVRARRFLRLTPRDGGLRVEGLLDPVAGETLRTALDALTPVPAAGDLSSGDHRKADALVNLAANALGSGAFKAGAQVRPHLSILVPVATWLLLKTRRRLQRASSNRDSAGRSSSAFRASGLDTEPPLAQLQNGTLVPFAALDVLACDALLQRVVLDAEGSPLDVGRTKRTFEGDLRRAILTRDRHCQYPGCTLRATWCEVHHLQYWKNEGPTSLANGITLCSRHHHEIHDSSITILTTPGGFVFAEKGGRRIGTTSRLDDRLLVPRPPGEARPHAPPARHRGRSAPGTEPGAASLGLGSSVHPVGSSPGAAGERTERGLW